MNIINTILFIGLGGFIGANLRYLIGLYINKYSHEMTGTLIVNITGSFLIALFYGYISQKYVVNDSLKYFFPIGLLGSYTTFSTFSYTTMILINEGNYMRAGMNIILSFSLCLFFAFIGFWISKNI
jgi:CrcB protein|tara:strand:- start:728 stop:1105 length:378 start_codon:yes stop_codon:yes gene_type:complete